MDKGPHLFKQPGPPYPGPNPRAPNKPLDPTIIHPSNQHPIYKRPGKYPNNIYPITYAKEIKSSLLEELKPL